ncbi:MAG: hypothetical protein ACRCTP_17765 [Aeromonas popoffii]|uniref:hypothetical protein n=1 Tax=Aeromonas popoffii TaxID=70856 RepID=UPI003F37513C
MTKQIHTIAVKALKDMKAAGIAQYGRARSGSFSDAKKLTQQWAKETREAVFSAFGERDESRAKFLHIIGCANSLTFRGWADLGRWLEEAETGLVSLIAEHAPMTYVKHHRSGRVRRFAVDSFDTINTQTKGAQGSGWETSAMTVGQALADISNGSAFLCNEQGEEITEEATTTPAPEWIYFTRNVAAKTLRRFDSKWGDHRNTEILADGVWVSSLCTVGEAKDMIAETPSLRCKEDGAALTKGEPITPVEHEWTHFQCLPHSGRTGNYRRVHASCGATDSTEILIDGKWEDSGMSLADMRRLMAFGYAEWIAQPDIPTDGAVKAQAQKMLRLMERRGFGPDMQIAQMWDDIDDICGLARSLRLQLIGDAGHTGNGLTNEEHLQIRALLDIVPTKRCFLDTLKMGWAKLHYELSKIVLA